MAARFLDQDFALPAHHGRVEGGALGVEQILQACEPFLFHRLVNLFGQVGPGRAGTRRIFERIGAGEFDLTDEFERILEVLIGFARKSNDEIRR